MALSYREWLIRDNEEETKWMGAKKNLGDGKICRRCDMRTIICHFKLNVLWSVVRIISRTTFLFQFQVRHSGNKVW